MTKEPFLDVYLKKMSAYGDITAKSMFGGYGVYFEGKMFALFAEDILYFKVDGETRSYFESKKQKPFVYFGKPGKPNVMSYYTIPKSAWKSRTSLIPWIELAVQASKRAAKKTKTHHEDR